MSTNNISKRGWIHFRSSCLHKFKNNNNNVYLYIPLFSRTWNWIYEYEKLKKTWLKYSIIKFTEITQKSYQRLGLNNININKWWKFGEN